MQAELDAEVPELQIALLGINGAGYEGGVPAMVEQREIPLLQDTAAVDAWSLWRIEYRDVVILGRDNVPVGVFNLTANDLAGMGAYATLKGMLIDAASP